MHDTSDSLLDGTPYATYVYSYPHKTAYRTLDPAPSLRALWAKERLDALFLYLHVPFCEMRCGFCNLFTTVHPGQDIVEDYLGALERQAVQVRGALGDEARFAQLAVGGGTPTYLDPGQLQRLFAIIKGTMGAATAHIPVSVETSPQTATADRLAVLQEHGVDRVSIGVQSFLDDEVNAINRRQQVREVEAALGRIRAARISTLNLDLMYGLPGQSAQSWQRSLEIAMGWDAEEIYLYPLYVRPLTRMGVSDAQWDDERLALYRQGRDVLLEAGYRQVSMRMFQKPGGGQEASALYRCQEDGMVGLGCGARSYTRQVHYSSAYAVGPKHVKGIIRSFIAQSDEDFARAQYGVVLDREDQLRRYTILSLLSEQGLNRAHYTERFGTDPLADLPRLAHLQERGLATLDGQVLSLTAKGMERSDAIGPWLFSTRVQALMEAYDAQ